MKYKAIFWIIVVVILQGGQKLAHGAGFTLHEIGRWNISINHESIEAVLEHIDYVQGNIVTLRVSAAGALQLDSREELSVVEHALEAISRSNFEPSRINKITIPLQNTSYERGVTSRIIDSKLVDACLERKYCYQAQLVANDYFKSIKAFDNLSGVLLEYGLVIKSVTIEDVAVSLRDNAKGVGQDVYPAASKGIAHCGGIIIIETTAVKE